MPPFEDIFRYLAGSWRMMNGKPDGLRAFDISADGFWASFFAIPVALPALLLGWVAIANDLGQGPAVFGGRPSIIIRLAIVDIGAWVLPLAAFAVAARPAGLSHRFAHYVIAGNWGAALLIWATLPTSLLRLTAGQSALGDTFTLAVFMLTLVLSWRLTNVAIGKGPAVASAVFSAMLLISLAALFGLQNLLGLGPEG